MPRFYFHLHNDMDVPDPEGKEFSDLHAAREWALSEAQKLIGETAKEEGRISLRHYIDIEDESGRVLASVPFKNAIEIET